MANILEKLPAPPLPREFFSFLLAWLFSKKCDQNMYYGLEISEKIEIKHVFRPKTFFPLSNTFQTSCHSAFKINHRFECNYKWLIYLLTFNKCKKQCTGQTKDHFRSRWNKSLKVEVLIEENSISKNICASILKVKIIQVSVTTFL